MSFMLDSSQTLVLYCASARVFGRNHACISLHSRPRPQYTISIKCSHWSIFEFLVHDFPHTSYTEYIARSILFSLHLGTTQGQLFLAQVINHQAHYIRRGKLNLVYRRRFFDFACERAVIIQISN